MTLEHLYKQHSSLVYNLALQYTQNAQDAEEITQDVFLIVHEKLNTFRQESAIATWIYRITINKSLDYIKAKKRKKRFSVFGQSSVEEEINNPSLANFNHPGVALEDKEALEGLFALINALPDNQKTALILLKIEGFNQKETAEIMQLSAKAVESLLQRAKGNLKKKIDKSEGK